MPFRDAGPWLEEALGSLLAQSHSHWELIAIDDGSGDSGPALLAGLALRDRRVRMAATDPASRGIVAALNLGLARARYPFLARMDADDIAHPNRLKLQVEMLAASPDLFGVTCVVEAFPVDKITDGMRRYLSWQNSLITPDELLRDRFVESPLIHPSLLVRSELLRERLGGWQDRGWAEDWDLLLRAFAAGLRIARHPQALLAWRLHEGQATRRQSRYSFESFLAARAHFLGADLRERVHGRRSLWVVGAGSTGKKLGKALAREGLSLAGFIDLDPRKLGGRVRDGRRNWPVAPYEHLRDLSPRPFAVVAVGAAGARERIRSELTAWGWSEQSDFLVAA